MKIKNICIITAGYPSEKRMNYTFVEELVNQFSDFDINCYVITPQSISKNIVRGIPFNKRKYNRHTENGKKVEVYSPYYWSFSNINNIINTNKINLYNFVKNTEKVFKKLRKKIQFDVIYSHFIFPSAICANKIGKKYNIPVFFAYGENTNYTIEYLGAKKTKELLEGVNGVISVSLANKERLVENNIVPENIIKVFPNAINNKVFYKRDKQAIREKLGFNKNDFIVIFVGRFIKLKGIDRLCNALNMINNNNIKAIFIGDGDIKPEYNNILFQGTIDHKKIADYLSASDIFVLPTQAEGCCNAIIEAMACGLPIISSKETFNNDILDNSCSIRIDSNNIQEIKNAIEKLYNDNDLRQKLLIGAVEKSNELNIKNRAKGIIEYMENKIGRLNL